MTTVQKRRTHGEAPGPAQPAAAFDLVAFGHALETGDIGYLLSRYAANAGIRVVGPDDQPVAPRVVLGTRSIWSWLIGHGLPDRGGEVDLIDGGDRVAFTQRWRHLDGSAVLSASTAELTGGLISTQHTILRRDPRA